MDKDQRFFAVTVKREVSLRSATKLTDKAGNVRIKMMLSMELSGKSLVGAPGWVGDALEYVAKTHNESTIGIDFGSVDVAFSTNDLFDQQVKAPNVQLKKFAVKPIGSSENPDVALFFLGYAGFSHDLWSWCGEMKDFWAIFSVNAFDEAPGRDAESGDDDEPSLNFQDGEEEESADDDEDASVIVGDGFDSERIEALKPEHDADFVPAAPVPAPRKPRGFDKRTNPSVN